MTYSFSELTKALDETKEWLRHELGLIHTGRATGAILDSIRVDSYGAKVPLNQVSNVVTEDNRTLRVVPWGPDQLSSIESAINGADLGLSVSSDGKSVRVIFPDLTSETREKLLKLAKDKLEQARIAVKNDRNKTWEDIQEKEKEGDMSEDEKHRLKTEMQKNVDETNGGLEEMFKKKESELAA